LKLKKYSLLENRDDNANLIKLTNIVVNTITINIKKRVVFSEIISNIMDIFNPKTLLQAVCDNNISKILEEKFIKTIYHFRNVFIPIRYYQKYQDYELFRKKIKPHLNSLKSLRDTCFLIIKNHIFYPAITIIRLAQFALLIPPTTVEVECGFKSLNNIHNDSRSGFNNDMVNCLMIVKLNTDENYIYQFSDQCARKWILEIKKMKHINELLHIINKENKIYWKENEKSEILIKENENDDSSSLQMVSDEEKIPIEDFMKFIEDCGEEADVEKITEINDFSLTNSNIINNNNSNNSRKNTKFSKIEKLLIKMKEAKVLKRELQKKLDD
jgi:hypothetical protein